MKGTRKLAVAAGLAATVFTITATAATAAIGVSTAPGTAAPPATLAFYKMTPFGADPQPLGAGATSVALPPIFTGHPLSRPTGSILFDHALFHATVPAGGWNNWSHGYTGDVYYTSFTVDQNNLTMSLPAKTGAFYFYTEGDLFTTQTITVTGRDATGHQVTTSLAVTTPLGARYFGFYNTTGGQVSSITVSKSSAVSLGFAVGEFGISNQMLTKVT
jgi:hypothetical protein